MEAAPRLLLIHGAGFSAPMWSGFDRWFTHHGWSVPRLELPGHGETPGPPLGSIEEMADWVLGIARRGAGPCALVGHSMGALVSLEAAARGRGHVHALGLIGVAARMPVHPDLLAAARADDHAAIDMVNLWGFGTRASLGGQPAPGVWMLGMGERLLARSAPGVLHTDLSACDAYMGALGAAARIDCPTVVIAGERDRMTPLPGARALAGAIRDAQLVVLPGAGHMLPIEYPDATRTAVAGLLKPLGR